MAGRDGREEDGRGGPATVDKCNGRLRWLFKFHGTREPCDLFTLLKFRKLPGQPSPNVNPWTTRLSLSISLSLSGIYNKRKSELNYLEKNKRLIDSYKIEIEFIVSANFKGCITHEWDHEGHTCRGGEREISGGERGRKR